jgi:hypothetical protein
MKHLIITLTQIVIKKNAKRGIFKKRGTKKASTGKN